jgi:hypothetical protein
MTIVDHLQASMDEMNQITKNKNNPAGYMLERVRGLIAAFERKIGEDAEVGMSVAAAAPIRLRSITVSNPDMMIFNGVDESGASVCLLQHHSQMSLLLVAIPKLDEKPFRIGFT